MRKGLRSVFGRLLHALTGRGGAGGRAPTLSNSNGTVSVVADGHPAAPRLSNSNGTVTAEAV